MVTKTISITHEVYSKLKRMKGKDHSFSEILDELADRDKNDFSVLIGKNIDLSWEKVKKGRKRALEDDRREEILLGH